MFNRNNIILNYIFDKQHHVQKCRINNIKEKYINIYNYLLNIFTDSDSIIENIYRLYYNIYERPVCQYCGGHVKWQGKNKYAAHCCVKCSSLDINVKNKVKNTCLQKYGVDAVLKNKEIQNKIKETNLKKYGCENPMSNKEIKNKSHSILKEKYGSTFNWDKVKETCINKYGCANVFGNKDIIYKLKQTKLNLYNDVNYNNREKSKQTCLKKYGVENSSQNKDIANKISQTHLSEEYQLKVLQTYLKNQSFNKSKPEEDCYNLLKEKYPDIIRQYRSKLYPYRCDFYIQSLDLYIEYNGSDLHGFHPFNENDLNDILVLNELQNKSSIRKKKTGKSKSRYDYRIYTWTDLDIRKRNTAKEKNLNFIEFWNINEVKQWLYDQS